MENKVAVVTGGRRGLGRGICFSLAESGHDIVVIDLVNDEATEKTIAGINALGRQAAFVQGDIGSPESAGTLCLAAHDAFGRVDVLVSNAGVMVQDRTADVLQTTIESFDRLMSINLRGTFFLMQAFAQRMVTAQAEDPGFRTLITISSSNASLAKTTGAEYCISKAGIAMANKVFALKLAPHGIACYEVQPGIMKTDMNVSLHEKYTPILSAGLSPIPRWGTDMDVGRAVCALASGALSFGTGEVIHVDGGLHIARSPFESPFVREKLASS
jgi:3-oxoacyl-[acyl-carrier protein] reductase